MLEFFDKATKFFTLVGMIGFLHMALRLVEAWEKGLI